MRSAFAQDWNGVKYRLDHRWVTERQRNSAFASVVAGTHDEENI